MTEPDAAHHPHTEMPPALPYATPIMKRPGAAPGATLVFGALGLIFLGGCFMIGVLILNAPEFKGGPGAPILPKTAGELILEVALYVLAFSCFGGSLFLFTLAIRWLRKAVTG